MKNKFVKLIAIASLALVGCEPTAASSSGTSSTGEVSSTTESTVTPATSSTLPTFTINATGVKDSYEVGESFTVRFNVSSTDTAAAKTLSFALENANENKPAVTSSDKTSVVITTTGVNVTLYAKAIGKATLVATSTVNPNSTCRVELNVVKPLSSLSAAWKNINNLKNYTLNVTRTATSDEISQYGWDADAAVPSKRIKVTENSLIAEKATVGEELSAPTWGATYETAEGTSVLGLATDKDGYGFILGKDSTGYKAASQSRITGSEGYVSSENLSGYGDDASSPNDIFVTYVTQTQAIAFGGMRTVNSSWFSSFAKDHSNEYEIEADSTASSAVQYNVAFIKACLWQVIDFDSYWSTVTSGSSTQYADIVADIDMTITVVASNNVVISLDTGAITYTATLSDIGTTASETGLDTYLNTATTTAPELSTDMQLVVDAFKTYDYYIATKTDYGTYYQYFYQNYYFEYYPSDFISAYAAAGYGNLSSYGYVLVGNYAYQFTFTDEVKTDGTVTTPAKVTISDTPLQNTSGNTIDYSTFSDKNLAFATTIGSFSSTYTFGYAKETGFIYSFTGYSTSTGSTVYVSSSKTVSDELSKTFFGSKTIEQVISGWGSGYSFDSYSTQLSLTKATSTDESGENTTTLSSISLGFGSFSMQGQSGYMYPVTITFGHTANNYHQTIIDAIEAKAATPAD